MRDLGARVRLDLRQRVADLLGGEVHRFLAVVDSAGVPDEGAAAELVQAGLALEGAR